MVRRVKSTYVDIPIMLEIHADRWYNSRPYAAAGLNYMVNLQSNSQLLQMIINRGFSSTTHNLHGREAGIQFYSQDLVNWDFRGTFCL